MGPYAAHRRAIFDGVRNLITQTEQVNAGANSAVLYPSFILEDMRSELEDLERGAVRWYVGWIRQMFHPFPRTPRAFARRIHAIWLTLFRPLPPVVSSSGYVNLDITEK